MLQALTKSENEVIELKAMGFLEKEIADRRCVSIHTVKTQVKRAVAKAKARSTYHLVAKYAAAHPNMFKNLTVALFMSIQSVVMFSEYRDDYRRPVKNRTYKRVQARRKN